MNITVSSGITTIKQKKDKGSKSDIMKVIVIVTKDFIKHVKYLVKFVDENCVDEIIEDSRLEEAVFKLSTELKKNDYE